VDVLYHFGMSTASHNFLELFGDVKFVCCGGSPTRMEKMANLLIKELNITSLTKAVNICQSDRYVMFKVGPVLCINHGMGMPSMSIMLHELFKLLHHAQCKDVTIFRLGTSGGIGVPPGTVIVTEQAYNACLEPQLLTECLGKLVSYPTKLDQDLCNELCQIATELDVPAIKAKTMGTNDFYEGQGRIDGALCCYTESDKMAFLKKANDIGIRNIEMEAPTFASMTARAGMKGAIMCVTLLNRLEGDQVLSSHEVLKGYEERPCQVLVAFIKNRLEKEANGVNHHCTNGAITNGVITNGVYTNGVC